MSSLFREEANQRFRVEPWQPPLLSRPLSGVALGALAVFAAGALVAFATLFEVTRKEQARGHLAPASGWSRVSAPRAGVVARRLVAAGDTVEAGEVLLVLGSIEGLDESVTVERKLLEELASQRTALEERARLITARLKVDRALHHRERAAKEQELRDLEREVAHHRARLVRARQQLRDGLQLLRAGALSKAAVRQLEDDVRVQSLSALEALRGAGQLRADLAGWGARLEQLVMAADRERAALAGSRHALAMEESRVRGRGAAGVLAPRGGVVGSVRVSAGDQVRAGEALLDIVPAGEPLRARLFAPTAAMASVRPGQEVRVHLDAFPHGRHGAQTGRVLAISATTLSVGEAHFGLAPGTPVFRIDVEFPDGIRLAPEHRAALRPGMTLSADLVRDRATLADWLAEPLRGALRRV